MTTKHARMAVALATVAAVASVAGLVFADAASDRDALVRDIDTLLGSAANDLRGAAGSGAGSNDVASARGRVQQVKDKLSQLGRVQGDDSKAQKYVAQYPRYVEDFDRAAQPLGQIKLNQNSLGDLARRCRDLDRQLGDQAKRFELEKDGERIEELRRLALDAGGKAEEWWRDAEKKRDEIVRWGDDARRFSVSDELWSSVTSHLQDAVRRSLEYWMKDLADADKECKDLRLRDRHPEVERALRELAGTAKGKDAIYQQLDERLKRTESAIRELASDSSTSKLGDARSAMSEIERLVRELDAVKGADKKATFIASKWPEYVRAFAPAATALQGLKDAQFGLDAAPGRCEASTKELADQLRKFIDDKDPDGLTEGPRLAEAAGEKYTRAIALMDAARSTQRSLVTVATDFDPKDDRWGPLKRQIKAAADTMFEHWDKRTQEVHAKCDDLAKGARNPAIEKFLATLGVDVTSELKNLQDVASAWERDARGIYVLDCRDMQELWDAWCSVEIEPNENPEIDAVTRKTTEVIAREMQQIDGVLARLPAIRATARKLAAKARYRDAVGEIRSELDKQERRLRKLNRKNADWAGTNNPALQFTKTYGQQAHDRKAREHGCNVYDQPGYPGLGRDRPDCVVVKGKGDCWVYEFKPENWNGTDKLNGYWKAVSKYYTASMQAGTSPASHLGGSSFQALLEAQCRKDPTKAKKDDEIEFRYDYVFYGRCEQRYECSRDE